MSAWPTHRNLLRDGYEDVAEHVSRVIRRTRGTHALVIRKDGSVRLYPQFDRVRESDQAFVVGTYNRQARVEFIENDLIEVLKELSK